jgi:hypothetical protein
MDIDTHSCYMSGLTDGICSGERTCANGFACLRRRLSAQRERERREEKDIV